MKVSENSFVKISYEFKPQYKWGKGYPKPPHNTELVSLSLSLTYIQGFKEDCKEEGVLTLILHIKHEME